MYEIEDKENREQYQMQRSAARKDWVKNMAILFLTIMLVLTFFSNTILNYSLPQVATQYVQQGNITPKVRGSGVAEVEDPYSVKAPNGRVISAVNVKAGDEVKKDDVIFELQDAESEELKEARKEYNDAKANFQKALFSGDLTNDAVERIRNGEYLTDDEIQEMLDEVNSDYEDALDEDMEAGLEVERLSGVSDTSNMGDTAAAAKAAQDAKKLADAQAYKAETEAELTKATNARDATVKSIQAELELKEIQKTMDEAQAKVEELEKAEKGATVKSPITGTVVSVTYNAGDTTSSDTVGAVIQPEGKGMTVSFTCTKEQAQMLKVGQEAKPQNEWAYSEFKATLVSITTDSADTSGGSKILKFEIQSPEVEAGDNVQLTIGENTKSYDLTVPNNAVREDNNGKFILIVSSKESPLGNRYIATRVDVQVLDSDDLLTAISGPLSGYEYVITTTTKPVAAGMQVRLAEDVQQ